MVNILIGAKLERIAAESVQKWSARTSTSVLHNKDRITKRGWLYIFDYLSKEVSQSVRHNLVDTKTRL